MSTAPCEAVALLPDGRKVRGLHIIADGIERFAYHGWHSNRMCAVVLQPGDWVSIALAGN